MTGILAYCRAGYESDTSAELSTLCAEKGVYGYPEMIPGQGFVYFSVFEPEHVSRSAHWPVSQTVFPRQLVQVVAKIADLDRSDRITPVIDALSEAPVTLPDFGDVVVEYPDTEAGKAVAKFCRKFVVPLRQALRKAGLLMPRHKTGQGRLHVFFTDFAHCYIGYTLPDYASVYPMGICRLKFPPDAPSRSTLKLEEALQTMLSDNERERVCRAGGRAVDLGACPGGWTYQLVHRGMFVEAIDNGAVDDKLMQTGLVQHFALDGFTYKPQQGHVDLLVCDMIEKPDRVASLMTDWLCKRWTEHAIFNLKLPMKQRYETVSQAIEEMQRRLARSRDHYIIRARHLYHDRDEVTVAVIRQDR